MAGITKHFLIFIFCIFLNTNAFCQQVGRINIQYISLGDSILIREIKSTIAGEVNSNDPEHLFKSGLGYITLHINQFTNSDTTYSYYISPSFHYLKKKAPDSEYPLFYTYVAGKIILIYDDILANTILRVEYTSTSKARVRKNISSFLEKPTDKTFYDSSNHKVFRDKNFYLERFRFDSGKYIFFLKNSPPIIKKEPNSE